MSIHMKPGIIPVQGWELYRGTKDRFAVENALDKFLKDELAMLDNNISRGASIEVAIKHACKHMIDFQCSRVWGDSWAGSNRNILFSVEVIKYHMMDFYAYENDILFKGILDG